MTPNPGLQKRTRPQFTTEYKLKTLAEADACQHGEIGALLRREKLFSSQLTTGGAEKLAKTTPGPKPPSPSPGRSGTWKTACWHTWDWTRRKAGGHGRIAGFFSTGSAKSEWG